MNLFQFKSSKRMGQASEYLRWDTIWNLNFGFLKKSRLNALAHAEEWK
ncbi:hypothetical protein EBME_1148 [bacterium endosymbiont of Mortierella elongata FMR23-6]|nr:hypothetical protein EBME_1148 [bacterium endosymbiont of Mortierella elongata FMR23-6]